MNRSIKSARLHDCTTARPYNYRLPITLIFFFFITVFVAEGQEIKLRADIKKDSIWLGDQIELMLSAEQPVGASIVFPQIPDSLGDKIEILKRSAIDTTNIDATRFRLQQTFVITSFDSGPHHIPPFLFKIESSLLKDTLKTNDLSLFVKVPQVDLTKGPADIKKPFEAPVIFKEIAPWVMGIILAAAVIFLIIYAISRRRNNRPFFQRPEKPKLPAHIVALQELDKLKGEQLWQHDKVKDYYTRLTDIIRIYIEERFDLPAMEQTTYEILSEFRQKKNLVGPGSFNELKDILELADLVKFAKLTPLPDENHISLNNAYKFVEQTKLEEKVEIQQPEEAKKENITAVNSNRMEGMNQ